MVYIYLPYSLAFLALGFAMIMTARAPVPILPRRALWFLAAFGILHGFHEWIEMALIIQASPLGDGNLPPLHIADLVFTSLSFASLMQAGIEMLIPLQNWPTWSRVVPGGLLFVCYVTISVLFGLSGFTGNGEVGEAGDALVRYILGLPGSLLAAYAILVASRVPREVEEEQIRFDLTIAAWAFLGYGLATGLVPLPANFPPASLINTETFEAALGVPVEAFRAIFALVIAWFLSDACLVEAAWTQAELERLREEFISVVAHDLRSPITTISLNAEILERLPAQDHASERERTMLHNIHMSARRLGRMVSDLLDASRIEARRLALRVERVDLRSLTHDVVERSVEILDGHPAQVIMPDDLPPVEADPERFEQIMINLLSNAAKYSYPDTEIVIQTESRAREVVVSVTNYGEGISSDERPRLFSRYYRTEAVEKGREPGLGLGLYIAKGLVEAQGGRIWAESEIGKYATFCFTLPRSRS